MYVISYILALISFLIVLRFIKLVMVLSSSFSDSNVQCILVCNFNMFAGASLKTNVKIAQNYIGMRALEEPSTHSINQNVSILEPVAVNKQSTRSQ